MTTPTLLDSAVEVIRLRDPVEKATASRRLAEAWRCGKIGDIGELTRDDLPTRPGRPDRPRLAPPREVPRRRITRNPRGRVALLHALAHIELNAVDLAWDILVRFMNPAALPREFADDWVRVADEEAKHFTLLNARLESLGSHYGALTAHDGLWEAAESTAHDLLARLAVVPLVLEARGLDVTPAMISNLEKAEDRESAVILDIIHRDEISHVAIGHKWFEHVCRQAGLEPASRFRLLVRHHYNSALKPPFNRASRDRAGLPPAFYEPLAEAPTKVRTET